MSNSPNSRFELVQASARRFRKALEDGGLERVSLRNFPSGSCGDSCELLGEYLKDCGLGDWTYVRGIEMPADGFQSHGWLFSEGIYVDITEDQFDECDQPVVVSYLPLWEDRFPGAIKSHIGGLSYYGSETEEIRRDYAKLRFRADAV